MSVGARSLGGDPSRAERAEWHRKEEASGLSLSDLVCQNIVRVRTWTANRVLSGSGAERLSRLANNLNQLGR